MDTVTAIQCLKKAEESQNLIQFVQNLECQGKIGVFLASIFQKSQNSNHTQRQPEEKITYRLKFDK